MLAACGWVTRCGEDRTCCPSLPGALHHSKQHFPSSLLPEEEQVEVSSGCDPFVPAPLAEVLT